MIEYLRGTVEQKTPTGAIVEVNGVGYEVIISLYTSNALEEGSESLVYIHEILREDTHDAYGFATREERSIFRLLITVSGVGPNTARIMLSSYAPNELAGYIANGNEAALQAIKGIGSKTAQRIIVDLKAKVVSELGEASTDMVPNVGMNAERRETADEAVRAFVTLGYPQAAARKVVAKVLKDDPTLSLNELIKVGLRLF